MDNLACPASALAFFHHLWNDGSNFPVHFWESGSYFTDNVHPSCLQEDASISVTCSIAPFGVSCKIRTGCVSSIRIFGVVFLFYFSDGELAKRSSCFKTFLFFPAIRTGNILNQHNRRSSLRDVFRHAINKLVKPLLAGASFWRTNRICRTTAEAVASSLVSACRPVPKLSADRPEFFLGRK